MKRLRYVVIVAACVALVAAIVPRLVHASPKPNIVMLLLDDSEMESVTQMPNLMALARSGISLDKFYVTESSCCPSRSSLFTGEYVHNHHVTTSNENRGLGGYGTFRARGLEKKTIALALHRRGYATGLFGKYLNGYGPQSHSEHHIPPGWDRWFARFEPSYYDYNVSNQGHLVHFGHRAKDYSTYAIGRQAEAWIRHRHKPFFAYIAVSVPHSPYTTPPNHHPGHATDPSIHKPSFNQAPTDKPRYVHQYSPLTARDVAAINKRYNDRVAMQLSADDVLGQITSELQHLGELSNTYIFVTSDNGWMHGEHRITADKLVPYEESVHMPMFVTGPGITPGAHSSDLTSMVDLYATFDAIAGGDEQRDGRSMLPIFSGGSNGRRQDLIENLSTNPRRPLNSKSKGPPDYFGLVDGQYKYVHYFTGEQELYDLSVDPDETTNLVASDPSVVATLRAKLGPLEHCSGAGCRTADSAP